MLQTVYTWCSKWRLKVNATKTKIMHFRSKTRPLTNEIFYYGAGALEIVKSYKYLGVIFDEHMTFEECAQTLSKAAGRKLGHMFVMNRKLEGMGYKTFTRLYESRIDPVAFYASSVWGVKNFKFQDNIQNKAIRLFLGVSRYTSNVAIKGDMGWPSTSQKVAVTIFRLWNRFVNMPNHRITKRIFLNDQTVKKGTWSSQVLKKLKDLYGEDTQLSQFKEGVDLTEIKALLREKEIETWKKEVTKYPKLRTYTKLKDCFGKENYVDNFLSKNRRSLIAQMRTGTSFLRIETGRYERQKDINGQWEKLPEEKRICRICETGVENEIHFIFRCTAYTQPRVILRHNIETLGYKYTENTDMLSKLLSEKKLLGIAADYLQFSMEIRKTLEKSDLTISDPPGAFGYFVCTFPYILHKLALLIPMKHTLTEG